MAQIDREPRYAATRNHYHQQQLAAVQAIHALRHANAISRQVLLEGSHRRLDGDRTNQGPSAAKGLHRGEREIWFTDFRWHHGEWTSFCPGLRCRGTISESAGT